MTSKLRREWSCLDEVWQSDGKLYSKYHCKKLSSLKRLSIVVFKTYYFTTPFKDNIRKLADQKANITKDDVTSQNSDILV